VLRRRGRYADFNALRHTIVSLIVRGGATSKVVQTLARRSTVQLTMGRYAHASLYDLTAAVNTLPSLGAACPAESSALAATGTGPEKTLAQTLSRNGPIRGISGDNLRLYAAVDGAGRERKKPRKTGVLSGVRG
jgi:hypothetical protein